MNFVKQAATAFTTCFVLIGCGSNTPAEPIPSNGPAQRSDITNGFFRSGVIVTDGSGAVKVNARVQLNTVSKTLVSADETIRRAAPQQRAIPPQWAVYGFYDYDYDYDDSGNLISHEIVTVQPEGDVTTNRIMEYHFNGKLIGTTELDKGGQEWTQSYSYDAEGLLTQIYRNLTDENIVGGAYFWDFEYDSEGKLERMAQDANSIPGPGDLTNFYYDSANRLIESQKDIDSDGSVDIRSDYSYDVNGNVSQIVKYNSLGAMFQQIDYTYTATDEAVFNETLFEMLYAPE